MRVLLIGFFALIHLAYAGWVLVDPVAAAGVSGLLLDGAAARGEFRALFGGLVAAMGLVIACSPFVRSGKHALRTLGWLYAGLAAGRAVALIADGWLPYTATLLAAEGGFGIVLFLLARGCAASASPARANPQETRK